ncbi:unnamed protein product, partial [Discosporangium mesarthrocarpum]
MVAWVKKLALLTAVEALHCGGANHLQLDRSCRTVQATWRGSLGRTKLRNETDWFQRLGEVEIRVRRGQELRLVGSTFQTWHMVQVIEAKAAMVLQGLARGLRGRRRAQEARAERDHKDNLIACFRLSIERRRKMRCFRAVETYVVEAYGHRLKDHVLAASAAPQAVHLPGKGEKSAPKGGFVSALRGAISPGSSKYSETAGAPAQGSNQPANDGCQGGPRTHRMDPVTQLGWGDCKQHGLTTGRGVLEGKGGGVWRYHHRGYKTQKVLRHSTSPSGCSSWRSLRWKGHKRLAGIVWEGECASPGESSLHVEIGGRTDVGSQLWAGEWPRSQRSRDYCSSHFFRAFDKVRRTGLLTWDSRTLSEPELAALSHCASTIVMDPSPSEEVWRLVAHMRCPTLGPVKGNDAGGSPSGDSPLEVSGEDDSAGLSQQVCASKVPQRRNRLLTLVLCNGLSETFGWDGAAAVAELLKSAGHSGLTSVSLSGCPLGNMGALVIAKALSSVTTSNGMGGCHCGLSRTNQEDGDRRGQIWSICLEGCNIGNAGALALAHSLCSGAVWGKEAFKPKLRKLVLSGNHIGGVKSCTRALRDVMTQREGCLEVLDLSHCSMTDGDVASLCRGIATQRCQLVALNLSGNHDVRDLGAK